MDSRVRTVMQSVMPTPQYLNYKPEQQIIDQIENEQTNENFKAAQLVQIQQTLGLAFVRPQLGLTQNFKEVLKNDIIKRIHVSL